MFQFALIPSLSLAACRWWAQSVASNTLSFTLKRLLLLTRCHNHSFTHFLRLNTYKNPTNLYSTPPSLHPPLPIIATITHEALVAQHPPQQQLRRRQQRDRGLPPKNNRQRGQGNRQRIQRTLHQERPSHNGGLEGPSRGKRPPPAAVKVGGRRYVYISRIYTRLFVWGPMIIALWNYRLIQMTITMRLE